MVLKKNKFDDAATSTMHHHKERWLCKSMVRREARLMTILHHANVLKFYGMQPSSLVGLYRPHSQVCVSTTNRAHGRCTRSSNIVMVIIYKDSYSITNSHRRGWNVRQWCWTLARAWPMCINKDICIET
jgi:hypothetical protein